MKKSLLVMALSALFSTAASAQFQVTEQHANLGSGEIVTLEKTNKFHLAGEGVKVGDYMPSVQLMTSNLKPFDTSATNGKVKIYSLLTSVDTPVCVQQAAELSQFVNENKASLKDIEFYAISADTPFAQQRFISEHELTGVEYLSDSVEHEFGEKTGALIKELGLLTRSIVVTDQNNKIILVQRVPELTTLPDLAAAVELAKKQG